jgi:hypothetical protein
MEHITFDFVLGFLLAVALMAVLWVPLFFFDYRAEKKRGAEPVGSGENPPSPPLDRVHINEPLRSGSRVTGRVNRYN